jgi:epoxyqueuosine reductase QueG
MTDFDLLQELQQESMARGVAVFGCADLEELPAEDREGFPLGISMGLALDRAIVAGIRSGPTIDYAAEYRRINSLLEELGAWCARFLRGRGHRVRALPPTSRLPREHPLATLLPHKTVATRAGIGWVGRCALLVTESHGAAVR